MKKLMRLALPALAMLGAVSASAVRGEEGTNWKLSGYGTVGAAATNTDEAQFRAGTPQSRGASRSPDFGVDSRLGLQGAATFNETYSAVGQVLTSRWGGSDRPRLEWLFVQISATPWLDVRVGRMVLPVFMISASRNVGYSTHWARAPSEVYGHFPITSYDGVQAQFRTDWNSTHFVAQASSGHATGSLVFVSGRKLAPTSKTLHSLNLVVERGDWTFRVGDTIALGFQLKNAPVPPVTDRFSGVGLSYDNGASLLQAEYVARRQSHGGPYDSSSYYVTAGQRLGAWMPYLIFSHFEPKGSAWLNQSRSHSTAAGVRWDAFRNAAFKAQVESVPPSSLNLLGGSAAGAAGASKVRAFTLLVDFVF